MTVGRAEYKPSDYHGGFTNRNVTLREAFSRSLNVPTVEVAMSVELNNVAETAQRGGLERPRAYPSMALGTSEVTPLELAAAYTSFANDGTALRPIPIKSVGGGESVGSTGRVQATSSRVFSPQVAYLMTNLLQSVVDEGTASRLRAMGLKGAIAGKTGTSSDGCSPRLIVPKPKRRHLSPAKNLAKYADPSFIATRNDDREIDKAGVR